MEVSLKGKALYSWPPCTDQFSLALLYWTYYLRFAKLGTLMRRSTVPSQSPQLGFPDSAFLPFLFLQRSLLEKLFGLLTLTLFSQIERHEVCSNMICHWQKTGWQKDDDMMRKMREKERVCVCVRERRGERERSVTKTQKKCQSNLFLRCDVTVYKVFRNQFQKHFQTKKTENWILQRISSNFSSLTISENKHL